jgi:hypothetical protein
VIFVQTTVKITDFVYGDGGLGLPLDDLPEITKQNRKKQAQHSLRPDRMMGADTETVKGGVWLFSTERGVWEISDFGQLAAILWSKEHSRKWKKGKKGSSQKSNRGIAPVEFFFWNLKFDSQAIFHLLPDDDVLELMDEGEVTIYDIPVLTQGGDSEAVDFRLKYIEGKYLEIKPLGWHLGQYKMGPCKWWDIAQFYGKMRLQTAATKFLNESKVELCEDGTKLDASRFDEEEYREQYREDIERYAVVDAVLTGRLARYKREEFISQNVRFIQPYSLANVAQRHLLDHSTIPTINDFVKSEDGIKLLQQALTAYRGGWFECLGAGSLDAIATDLASAYPYIMRWLPDVSKGYFVKGDEEEHWWNWIDERQPYSIGFAEATVMFERGLPIHPLCVGSAPVVTPRFVRGWFTADELAEARLWPHSQMIIGEWFYHEPDGDETYPFRHFVDSLYEIKMSHPKGTVEYQVSKILLNSAYGKLIQATNGKAGKMWNPLYAAVTTGGTRARLAELNRQNDFKAVSIATDGVIFRTEDLHKIPNRPLPAPHNLGQWELEGEGPTLIAMSGVYSMQVDGKTKTTFRGTASLFLRDYAEGGLFRFCAERRDLPREHTTHYRPLSAKEARIQKDLSLMNQFVERKATFSALGDSTKRAWRTRYPTTFGDLMDSWWDSYPHQQIEALRAIGSLHD